MHTYCLQISSLVSQKDELEKYSASEMEGIFMNNDYQRYVDYVEELVDEEAAWEYMLKLFRENGCEVNENVFTVVDMEKFSRFLLNCEENVFNAPKTWEEVATFIHRSKVIEYCNFPTVFNDCPYDNIFDALRYSLYSYFPDIKTKENEPKSFVLLGVFSCHL